jgi:crossover junction endodeoxyribonuclease RuvC
MARFLGIDPGLQCTGWGVIECEGARLIHIGHGAFKTLAEEDLPKRLEEIHQHIRGLLQEYKPEAMSVEEIFVNKNPRSSLKLAMARGIVLMTAAECDVSVFEYPSTVVKRALVGNGHAQKDQVAHMVRFFLPKAGEVAKDAADALAVAICHAHTHGIQSKVQKRILA